MHLEAAESVSAGNDINAATSSAALDGKSKISNKSPDSDDKCGLQETDNESHSEKLEENSTADRRKRGWRKLVRNFTPSWFSIVMGTGIVSILLHNLPYNGIWLYWISVVIFALNVVIFSSFLFLSMLRYILYPKIWIAMIRHPAQSLFVGTFPMGLATIVNMTVFVCVPAWGDRAIQLAWALWWIDVVISVACCFYLPFVIMYIHKADLSAMTAVWLLPIVSTIVASASGGIVADVLPDPQHALWTLVVSYVLWGTGVPLAMMILVMYLHRLTIYKLPPVEVIVSVFLPLGPLGQGGFSIMQLGTVAMKIFPQTGTLSESSTNAGDILYVAGWLIALIMWGFGLVWLFLALASISRSKFPFNMGWWGFTFPLGVFAVSTATLGKEIPSTFFNVLGTIFSIAVTIFWLIVGVGTIKKAICGDMLFSPCLKDAEKMEAEKRA